MPERQFTKNNAVLSTKLSTSCATLHTRQRYEWRRKVFEAPLESIQKQASTAYT
jgi:hypothetical protein